MRLLLAATSLIAPIVAQTCESVTAQVQHIVAAGSVVVESGGEAVVTLDGSADAAASVTGGLETDQLRFTDSTDVDLDAVTALRCQAEPGVHQMPTTGALCVCREGLWVAAGNLVLPCKMGMDVRDGLSSGVAAWADAAMPSVGLDGAQLTIVPSADADVLNECTASSPGGAFRTIAGQCYFVSTMAVPFADARWNCLAAGGELVAPDLSLPPRANGDSWASYFSGTADGPSWVGTNVLAPSRIDGTGATCGVSGEESLGSQLCADNAKFICSFPDSIGQTEPVPVNRTNAGKFVLAATVAGESVVSYDDGATLLPLAQAPGDDIIGVAVNNEAIIMTGVDAIFRSDDDMVTIRSMTDGEGLDIHEGQLRFPDVDPLHPEDIVTVRDDISVTPKSRMSRDGGFSWTRNTEEGNNFMNGISIRSGVIISAANSGNLYRSGDYGATTVKIDRGTGAAETKFGDHDVNMICATDDGEHWLAGSTQGISFSSDFGVTWTASSNGASLFDSGYFNSCSFQGNTGRVAATSSSGGRIIYSDNFGDTWSTASGAFFQVGKNLQINEEGKGISCGAGNAVHTTDGGATWTAVANVPASVVACSIW